MGKQGWWGCDVVKDIGQKLAFLKDAFAMFSEGTTSTADADQCHCGVALGFQGCGHVVLQFPLFPDIHPE